MNFWFSYFLRQHGIKRTLIGILCYIYWQFKKVKYDFSKEHTVSVNGCQLSLIPNDAGISEELLVFNCHEPFSTKVLSNNLHEGMVCLDVGDPLACGDGCFPGNPAPDTCDTYDNDCDTTIDEDPEFTWYEDVDGDGFGDALASQAACTQPAGYVADSTDCDDENGNTYPGATEVLDGVDNQCPGDEGYAAIDEGMGITGLVFTDRQTFCWDSFVGNAPFYEVAVSIDYDPEFEDCVTDTQVENCRDVNTPFSSGGGDEGTESVPAGEVRYYLVHAIDCYDSCVGGTFGQGYQSEERTIPCTSYPPVIP